MQKSPCIFLPRWLIKHALRTGNIWGERTKACRVDSCMRADLHIPAAFEAHQYGCFGSLYRDALFVLGIRARSQQSHHSQCYCTCQFLSPALIKMAWTSLFWEPWQVNTPTWHMAFPPSLSSSVGRFSVLKNRFYFFLTHPYSMYFEAASVCCSHLPLTNMIPM